MTSLSKTDEAMASLQPFVLDEALRLPGFTGKRAVGGVAVGVSFIATEDHDGQVELSLSVGLNGTTAPTTPSDADVRAFFDAVEMHPLREARTKGKTRHYVMVGGSGLVRR